jgi:hypothetical protein
METIAPTLPKGRHIWSSPRQRDLVLSDAGTQVQSNQAVAVDNNLGKWINGVFQHIGKNFFPIVLTTCAAAVVRGAINANLLWAFGITGGLPALAVAVGAAMATSLIIGAVRNIFREEKLTTNELLMNAIGAGVISGLIGNALGIHIDSPPPTLPDELPPWPEPEVTSPYAEHYMWDAEVTDEGYKLLEAPELPMISTNEAYPIAFDSQETQAQLLKNAHSSTSLLEKDYDWFVFENADGEVDYAMHRDGLERMAQMMEQRSKQLGLEGLKDVGIVNISGPIGMTPMEGFEDIDGSEETAVDYRLLFSPELLTLPENGIQAVTDHEFGHVYSYQTDMVGTFFQTPYEAEFFCDDYALRNPENYPGLTEMFIHHAIELDDITEGSHSAFVDSVSHSGHKSRLQSIIYQAAQDDRLTEMQREAYVETLNRLQNNLTEAGIGDKIDLLQLWEASLDGKKPHLPERYSWVAEVSQQSANHHHGHRH